MENKNNSRVWSIVIGLIVVILVIFFVVYNKKQVAVAPVADTQDDSALVADANVTEDVTEGSVHVAAPAAALSYNDALKFYGSNRIQFDTSCRATPNKMTITNNVNLMLDNRSAVARTFHLGYMGNITIKPWGFKVVNFSSATLPRAVIIDCGTLQNVGEVSIQR